jgi:dynein heavy chain 1
MKDIAEVMLYSQGFSGAEFLAKKIVPLFHLFSEQLSKQDHYDFGLRSLKSVLVCAGAVKRLQILSANESVDEPGILLRAIKESIEPKLVTGDRVLFIDLLQDIFGSVIDFPSELQHLKSNILEVCKNEGLSSSDLWMEKVLQLHGILKLHHGVMLVGDTCTGKSTALRVLLAAESMVSKQETEVYTVDAKSMSKEELYGRLDSVTSEWTDGLFTGILRRIVEDSRGESRKRHYIVFDCDVDPVWVENLNSLLDDNKILSLPTGERIQLPSNVKLVFEVEDLRKVTPWPLVYIYVKNLTCLGYSCNCKPMRHGLL